MRGQISWFERMAFLAAHPKGSILWTEESENPGDRYGGTWTLRTAGQFLIPACAPDADDQTYAAGNTGGAAAVTLTENELPTIKGSVSLGAGVSGASGGGYGAVRTASGVFTGNIVMQYGRPTRQYCEEYDGNSYRDVNMSFGGGAAHNNMPPWIAMYCWQRTA